MQGCQPPKDTDSTDGSDKDTTMMESEKEMEKEMQTEKWTSNGLTLRKADPSTKYPDASLKVNEPKVGQNLNNGEVNFSFGVMNYELKKTTPDQSEKNLAFSDKGQHIHLILNNGPYSAIYENSTTQNLDKGSYVGIAFFARSYHESVKNPEASFPFAFSVGEESEIDTMLSKPLLFYSRPKGTYPVDKSDPLLFDFYPVNVELGDEYKVRLTIDGEAEFIIDKWQAFYVEGLEPGEHDFRTELLDSDMNPVMEEFNTVTRTITIE